MNSEISFKIPCWEKYLTNIFLLGLILISFNTFGQTHYYVDKLSGNDENNGTSTSSAWKTIQKSFERATPNSIVFIRGGTYNENLFLEVQGTLGNPIEYRNYQNENVMIDGTGTSENELIYIENKSNLIFRNLTIQNKTVNNATGILLETTIDGTAKNISFINLKIKNIKWNNNPNLLPTSDDNSHPFLIFGTSITEQNAIENILIDSLEVSNNINGFSENISIVGNVKNFTVSNCIVHDNTNIGIDLGGNYGYCPVPALDHARDGKVYNCTTFNNISLYSSSAGIYVDGGHNITIERNRTYYNGYGIEVGCEENGTTENIIVRDNLIYSNMAAGMHLGGYDTNNNGQVLNSVVSNNTFYNNDLNNWSNGELILTRFSNCKVIDNVFYTSSQNTLLFRDVITPQQNNIVDYNCWFTPSNDSNNIEVHFDNQTYNTFSQYRNLTGYDAHSFYGNPDFVDTNVTQPDLHLNNSSACINSGDPAFIAGDGETDFDGKPRIVNSIVDIGCFEFGSSLHVNDIGGFGGGQLKQNYPNPCTTATTIAYHTTNNTHVSIKVYNSCEQVVAVLVDEEKPQGSYEVEFNTSNLSKGIYFYKMQTDGFKVSNTLKFIKL
jgi:hypothetical protein